MFAEENNKQQIQENRCSLVLKILLPSLQMNISRDYQAVTDGFRLTAEFQELVTPMEMTDRTSVGVLI